MSGRRVAYGVVLRGIHTTWGVVATKMSEGPPLKSLTPLKIRPSQEDSNLTQFVLSNFPLQYSHVIHGVKHPIYRNGCRGGQEEQG